MESEKVRKEEKIDTGFYCLILHFHSFFNFPQKKFAFPSRNYKNVREALGVENIIGYDL